MAVDERTAISQLQHGDIRGLETLVRSYQMRAVRAAYLITHDRPLAEDIVQSAFIRAYERIGQFDATRPFGPWFLRSVANDASKAAARRRRFVSLDSGRDDDDEAAGIRAPEPDPELMLLRAETDDEVWTALEALPPAQRSAVVLRYHLELPEAEVAERLGVAPGTAKSRLHNARKRLQVALVGLRPRVVRPNPPLPTNEHTGCATNNPTTGSSEGRAES
jgi:RNA polymerase sigma-70 factor (ECF subfamily)